MLCGQAIKQCQKTCAISSKFWVRETTARPLRRTGGGGGSSAPPPLGPTWAAPRTVSTTARVETGSGANPVRELKDTMSVVKRKVAEYTEKGRTKETASKAQAYEEKRAAEEEEKRYRRREEGRLRHLEKKGRL